MFGNRKKKRDGEILDTSARKRERSRGRWATVVRVGLGLAVVGGIGYGVWWGWRWSARKLFRENPHFTLRRVVVENSDGFLSSTQVVQASGAQVGQNLFALDLNQVRRDIELLSLVERAEVRRDLPDTLTLRVTERVPVLRLAVYFPTASGRVQQSIVYLDRSAHLIELSPQLAARFMKLPWLTGLRATDVRVGYRIESSEANDALQLLSDWETSAASGLFELIQIDVSRPNQLALVNAQGSVVVVAPPDFRRQLARLAAILTHPSARGKIVRLADLTVKENIPVVFKN